MNYIYNDKKFDNIIRDVMDDIDFKEIDTCVHHGISRLEHSLRVSYYSYKVTKVLGLDYKETAIAGLLHDFFLSKNLNIPDKFLYCISYNEPSEVVPQCIQSAHLILLFSVLPRTILDVPEFHKL